MTEPGAAVSRELFTRIRESYALVAEMGLPTMTSDYWRTLLAEGRQEHGGKGDFIDRDDLWLDFRRNVITKGLDNANVPEEAFPKVEAKLKKMHAYIAPRIPADLEPLLEESPIGNPHRFDVGGRAVTQSSLEYTFMLSHLAPYVERARTIVDIGGGYGGLARLIKRTYPDRRLVLLDLPEVGAIQTYFLSRAFPEATVLGLRDVAAQQEIDPGTLAADFLVLPGQLIERLRPGSFELAINTRSMMEMDLETVTFYLEHVQSRLAEGGALYCLNRYEKKTRLKDYPFDGRWRVAYSEPWPEVIDQNPHRELVAIRTAEPVEDGLREHVAGFPPHEKLAARLRAKLAGLNRPGR